MRLQTGILWKKFFASGIFVIAGILMIAELHPAVAQSRDVKISESTNFYGIRGHSAPEFAVSMSRNGPYSRSHRRRAWATATRDLTYQLVHRKTSKGCSVKRAKVRLKVTYTMPKLRVARRVSKRERARWRRMYRLLNTHERVHGKFYKQFARKVQKSLLKLSRKRTCRALEASAKKLVERLNVKDRERNAKFDVRDQKNYRRMVRIYSRN